MADVRQQVLRLTWSPTSASAQPGGWGGDLWGTEEDAPADPDAAVAAGWRVLAPPKRDAEVWWFTRDVERHVSRPCGSHCGRECPICGGRGAR